MELEPVGYGGMYWSVPLYTSQGESGILNVNLGDLFLTLFMKKINARNIHMSVNQKQKFHYVKFITKMEFKEREDPDLNQPFFYSSEPNVVKFKAVCLVMLVACLFEYHDLGT